MLQKTRFAVVDRRRGRFVCPRCRRGGSSLLKRPYPGRSTRSAETRFLRRGLCGHVSAKARPAHDQDYVFNQSGLDPALGRGCYTRDLAAALRKIGFRIGKVWYEIPAAGAAAAIETQWQALYADLAAGTPSIVCMYTAAGPGASEHFRLVLGYDAAADAVIYHEPAETPGAYWRMPRAKFLSLWPLRLAERTRRSFGCGSSRAGSKTASAPVVARERSRRPITRGTCWR